MLCMELVLKTIKSNYNSLQVIFWDNHSGREVEHGIRCGRANEGVFEQKVHVGHIITHLPISC